MEVVCVGHTGLRAGRGSAERRARGGRDDAPQEAQAARQATEEAQARQQRMEAVQRLAAEKERRRCNVYAMNAILRM